MAGVLEGKVALVTGASRGIGRGIAFALAAAGCDVLLTGRDQTALAEVAGEVRAFQRKAEVAAVDLKRDDAPETLITTLKRAFGRLDILINNAGTTKRGDFLKLTDADWQEGWGLKFFAHVRLTRAAWPLLVESKGSVVVIGGTSGRMPEAEFTIGSSVNAACAAFAKALADIGRNAGVQVNTIHPGHVETDRLRRLLKLHMERTGNDEATEKEKYRREINIVRFGLPEDVASLVTFIASPASRWLHGATIDMDGGEVKGL